MVAITLPDGSVRSYEAGHGGRSRRRSAPASPGPVLARTERSGTLAAPSRRIRTRPDYLQGREGGADVLPDCAHVLAEAVELWPDTQVTIGPNIENGFYYDFARSRPFTPEDLDIIEKRMHEIVDRDEPITREVWDRSEAARHSKPSAKSIRPKSFGTCPPTRSSPCTPGRLDGSLPRSPHDQHEKVGHAFKLMKIARLLAGRPRERDASAHLRHRLADRRTTRRVPAHAGGGGKARPPEARQNHGPTQDVAAGSVFRHPRAGGFIARCGLHAPPLEDAGYMEVNTPQLARKIAVTGKSSGKTCSFPP